MHFGHLGRQRIPSAKRKKPALKFQIDENSRYDSEYSLTRE